MLKFVFQLFIIALLWFFNARSKRTFLSPSSFLIGIYLLSAALGIATLFVVDYTDPFSSKYWEPMLIFDFFIISFLYPFKYFKETVISSIKLPNKDVLDVFSFIIITLSFFSIIYFSSTVNMIFSLGNLSDSRNIRYEEGEFVETGILNTVASVSASLYVFALLFFFVYSVMGGNKKRRLLLLIASFSEPIHVLAYVGRDGIVSWLFSFIFLYLLFKPFLAKTVSIFIRKIFIVIAVISLIPFALISVSRFGESDNKLYSSLIRYMGESFINGPLYFGLNPPPTNIGQHFPLFCELIGSESSGKMDLIQIGDWKSFQFSTFVVSFYESLDIDGLFFICIFMLLFFFLFIRNSRISFSAHTLLLYILYFQIISQGVFYFRHGTRGGNLFIIICLLLSPLFYLWEKDPKAIVLNKNNTN